MSTDQAVRKGIATTAGTVTSAAVVMVAVFSVFGALTIIDMKEMGVGMAVAVLIDATIIRGVLLPAAMTLLGDWNWYLPKWLDRRLPGGSPDEPATRVGRDQNGPRVLREPAAGTTPVEAIEATRA